MTRNIGLSSSRSRRRRRIAPFAPSFLKRVGVI